MHPRLEIEEDALAYVEELIYKLLAQLCAAQPHSLSDVEHYVQNSFAAPIDTWALNDAHVMMEKHAAKKKGVFVFPVDRLYQELQKVCVCVCVCVRLASVRCTWQDVIKYKVDLSLVQYIMAILDYISADILKVIVCC